MYVLNGLNIESNAEIPGLVATSQSAPADVTLVIGESPKWLPEVSLSAARVIYSSPSTDIGSEPNMQVWAIRDEEYVLLRYRGGIEFLVDARGTTVWSWWPAGESLQTSSLYLLGPVLGFVLQLRGYTSLHASCVSIEDSAIAFVGDCGAGKSTIAAAFAARGFQVLTDDVLSLHPAGGRFMVQHGASRIRLWPSSVQMLFGSEDALPRLSGAFEKRYLDVATLERVERVPIPLSTIYLLRDRVDSEQAPSIGNISLGEGLLEMVRNTYTSYLQDSARRARDFAFLGQVANQVRLRTLIPHKSPARLPELCELILEDTVRAAQ